MDGQFPKYSINFIAAWWGFAVVCLFFSILFLSYISTTRIVEPSGHNFKLYSALPETSMTVGDFVGKADGRSEIIKSFFKGYNSILSNYSNTFIEIADMYKLDYRLMPAIAMQESSGAKKVIKDSYNPFGYGIYGSKVIKFQSWEEAIERVGKALKEDYSDLGLTTPDKIMTKYTPPSLLKGGSWAKGVQSFMDELL